MTRCRDLPDGAPEGQTIAPRVTNNPSPLGLGVAKRSSIVGVSGPPLRRQPRSCAAGVGGEKRMCGPETIAEPA